MLRNGSAIVRVCILGFFAGDIIDLAAAAAAAIVVVAFARFVPVGVGRVDLTRLVAILIATAATFAAVSSGGTDPPR